MLLKQSTSWRVMGRIELEVPYTVVSVPAHGARLVQFEVKDEPVYVPEYGRLIRRQVVALVPLHSESVYENVLVDRLEDDLKSAREMTKFTDVKNFFGYIYLIGDNPLESQRYSFEKDTHRLVIEPAQLMWPDHTVVEIS